MEKILLKKIGVVFVIAGIVALTLFTGIIYRAKSELAFSELDAFMEQIEIMYDKSLEEEGNDILQSEFIVSEFLENIPTIYEKAVFAVDGSSGVILGATVNNEQSLDFENVNTPKDLISELKKLTNGRLMKVNGSYKFIKTKTLDHMILVGFIQADTILKKIVVQMCFWSIAISAFFIVIMVLLKRYLRRYLFHDFCNIQDNIKEIISGNLDVNFETQYNTEFKPLTKMLNDWKDSYKYEADRMSKIITSLDAHVAVFECLYYINQNFFSENMQSVLGVSDCVWDDIKCNPQSFEEYITSIAEEVDEDGMVYFNNKFIKISAFKVQSEFYGILVDRTQDIQFSTHMRNELQMAQKESENDALTKLINRKGFERYVKEFLSFHPGEGILLMFDLDNFKKINDNLGHPEGDKVLQMFADGLRNNFRKQDMIARLGGDEFVVFISADLSVKLLEAKIEHVLDSIRNRLEYYYSNFNVSTSIGVAYVDGSVNTYEDLYRCADVALYIAKQKGKNGYYINVNNIRCMRSKCIQCTKDCERRKVLGV